MKLNDSKNSALNFLLSIKRKSVYTSPFPLSTPTVATFNSIKSNKHQLNSYYTPGTVLGTEEVR